MLSPEDAPGWERAWDLLAGSYGDWACEDPVTGEVWQYMGTVIEGEGGRHEFRHRSLGPKGERIYFKCAVRPGDFLPRDAAKDQGGV